MMVLVRKFVQMCLKFNICFNLKHISGTHNELADCLSRLQISRAREIRPTLQEEPTQVTHQWTLSLLLLDT